MNTDSKLHDLAVSVICYQQEITDVVPITLQLLTESWNIICAHDFEIMVVIRLVVRWYMIEVFLPRDAYKMYIAGQLGVSCFYCLFRIL
jgi:hypothetical protein